MSYRVKLVDREVKRYDRELFARQDGFGAPICIYRKSKYGSHPPHLIFPLTDTWTMTGKPVEWGLEVITARLRAMDLWKNETEVDRIEAAQKKRDEIQAKDRKNNIEAFLADIRRDFARQYNGINTASLPKVDRRREYGA